MEGSGVKGTAEKEGCYVTVWASLSSASYYSHRSPDAPGGVEPKPGWWGWGILIAWAADWLLEK